MRGSSKTRTWDIARMYKNHLGHLMLSVLLLAALTPPHILAKQAEKSEPALSGDEPQQAEQTDLPTPPAKPAPSKATVQRMADAIAKRYGVERALIQAVIKAESNYNAHAVSSAGAVGLMQLMPATAADYGISSPNRLFDAETNLKTGTRHLKRLLRKYNDDYGRSIMAYNAGEGVVDRTNSNVTYLETLNYTEAVINHYRRNGGSRPTKPTLNKVRLLRSMRNRGKARSLMKRYLDPSLLSLSITPTLSIRSLNPSLHDSGPASKPMFELK